MSASQKKANQLQRNEQMKAQSGGANAQTYFCPLRLHHLFRR